MDTHCQDKKNVFNIVYEKNRQCMIFPLDMAKAFYQICEEEGLSYYMLGGTLLGAVRHGGFIPWDDNMDLGVPREYLMLL